MRRSPKVHWHVNADFFGVSLGADFVAEHEWGIKNLTDALGIKKEGLGIEKRRVTNGEIVHMLGDDNLYVTARCYGQKKTVEELNAVNEWSFRNEETVAAWDEEGFLIRTKTEQGKLKELYEALKNGNAAVWLGGGKFLENAGLNVCIIDKVPAHLKELMQNSDEDSRKLKEEAEKTGIKKKIDEKNDAWRKYKEVECGRTVYEQPPHGYYALSPAWINVTRKSKHKVMFWLNPANQGKNNYGWFTVEELELWLQNKGPIPIK